MERIEPVFTAIITMRSLQTWLTFLLLSVVGVVAASTRAGSVSSRSRRMAPFRVGAATPPTGTNRKQQQPSPQEAFSSWVKTLSQTVLDARRHLTAAAVARSTSIVVMYPADVFKTRLQMQQANPFRLSGGLFNGVGSSLLGQVPYGVLTFGSYELYKDYFLKNERFANVQPIFKYALAAVLGDLTGSGWLCPSEVIKQKVQAGMFPSAGAAVSSVWKQKGLIGFYEGYLGGVARDVPFRVAQLTTYELTKNLYLRMKNRRIAGSEERLRRTKVGFFQQRRRLKLDKTGAAGNVATLTPAEAAFCGALAGSFSAAITAPLDRIKTLLMTDSAAYGGSVVSCAAKIWRDDGIRGLTTGVLPRVVYIAPSVAIFFVVYEMTQQKLQHWKTQ